MQLLSVVLGLMMTTTKLLVHKMHVMSFLTKGKKILKNDKHTQTRAEQGSLHV